MVSCRMMAFANANKPLTTAEFDILCTNLPPAYEAQVKKDRDADRLYCWEVMDETEAAVAMVVELTSQLICHRAFLWDAEDASPADGRHLLLAAQRELIRAAWSTMLLRLLANASELSV